LSNSKQTAAMKLYLYAVFNTKVQHTNIKHYKNETPTCFQYMLASFIVAS